MATIEEKRSGQTQLGMLLTVLILLAAGYLAWNAIPFFYYKLELENLMEAQAAKASEVSDGEIRRMLMKKVEELEIPLDEDDLKINRFSGKITISAEYSEVLFVDLGGDRVYDIWVFNLNPKAERDL